MALAGHDNSSRLCEESVVLLRLMYACVCVVSLHGGEVATRWYPTRLLVRFLGQIPPEFAHDVHGHGLGDPASESSGNAANGTNPRVAPRGRKADVARAGAGVPSSASAAGNRVSGAVANSATQAARSSSVGRSGRAAAVMMTPGGAALPAPQGSVSSSRGVLSGAAGGDNQCGRSSPSVGPSGASRVPRSHADGHVRACSSGSALAPHAGGDHAGDGVAMDTEWETVDGRLPSLDMVTGGLGIPRGHGNAVSQAVGAEVRESSKAVGAVAG